MVTIKTYEDHSKDIEWLSNKNGKLQSWGRERLKFEVENAEEK